MVNIIDGKYLPKNFPLNLTVHHTFKNILIPIFTLGILFFSCKKTDGDITGTAEVALVNAAYGVGPVDLFTSSINITSTPVAFGTISGTGDDPYINVNAGLRNFRLLTATTELYNANFNIGLNKSYSLLLFDSINNAGGLRTLLIKDDLSIPDSGNAAIRFLHLSRDAGEIDLMMVSASDTLTQENISYLGNTSATENQAFFSTLDSGRYTMTVNVADTSIQLVNSDFQLAARKKYTFFIAGRRSDGSLRIFRYAHF